MSDDILNRIYDKLSELGEDEDLENWEVVDERPVDYEQEEALDKMLGLASTGRAAFQTQGQSKIEDSRR
jgi:hypothetical protein